MSKHAASSNELGPLDEHDEKRFIACVLRNPNVATIIKRMPQLGLKDWYLTAGGLFQTIWNVVDGREPDRGIKDYDVFYFDDTDLSYEAEDAIIQKTADLFADLAVEVEIRNEARVHLWYEKKFGAPAKPFTSCQDAINHFVSTTCCFGLTVGTDGQLQVYAPHGYADLFAKILRPNPVLAPRHVYETKSQRWLAEWPSITILPWSDKN
jgi:uncharacterized protein